MPEIMFKNNIDILIYINLNSAATQKGSKESAKYCHALESQAEEDRGELMRSFQIWKLVLTLLALVMGQQVNAANVMQPINYFELRYATDAKISPDGNWVAYNSIHRDTKPLPT